MRRAILRSVVVIAASAASVICSAAWADEYNQPDTGRSARPRPAVATPLSLMNLSPTKPLVRPYSPVGVEPREDRIPTAVDYKPFGAGPVGSVGVICRPISHALNATPVGAASDGQPGSQSQTLGANLAYTFR